jgi:hypothetical protein
VRSKNFFKVRWVGQFWEVWDVRKFWEVGIFGRFLMTDGLGGWRGQMGPLAGNKFIFATSYS